MLVFGFDVGPRSRRRASQPRPGGVASRCLSRARKSSPARYARSSCYLLTRSASSARARPGREAQEVSAAPGRPSFWLLFLGRTRKSDLPAARKPLLAFLASPQAIQQSPLSLALSRKGRGEKEKSPLFMQRAFSYKPTKLNDQNGISSSKSLGALGLPPPLAVVAGARPALRPSSALWSNSDGAPRPSREPSICISFATISVV